MRAVQGTLIFVRRDFVLFTPDYFDWIDVKHFQFAPTGLAAATALAMLRSHVRFRDHYASATSQDEDSIDLHGPYRLDLMGTNAYEPVDAEAVRCGLEAFARRFDTPEDDARRLAEVRQHVLPMLDGMTEFFRLRDLGEGAQHDWGYVLTDFTEFVAVDVREGKLALIVAAED